MDPRRCVEFCVQQKIMKYHPNGIDHITSGLVCIYAGLGGLFETLIHKYLHV